MKGILVEFFGGGGGRIEVAIWDGAGEIDRTARSPTLMTPQSTSIHGGGGWNGRGMVWRLHFINRNTTIRVRAGMKISRPVGFLL